MIAWLRSIHVPTQIAAIVTLAIAQVSVTLAPGWLAIGGNPIDLSSSAGRAAALLVVLGVIAKLLQPARPTPAAS